MQEEEYGFDSGIDIDRCGDCMSIFLNRGESLEINKYISSGASEEVQKVEEAKIDAEYENKWQKIVQEMYKKIKKDGLI